MQKAERKLQESRLVDSIIGQIDWRKEKLPFRSLIWLNDYPKSAPPADAQRQHQKDSLAEPDLYFNARSTAASAASDGGIRYW